jgi:hypothetical protein
MAGEQAGEQATGTPIGARPSDLLRAVTTQEQEVVAPQLTDLGARARAAEALLRAQRTAEKGIRLRAARQTIGRLLEEAGGDIGVVTARLAGLASEAGPELIPQVCAMIEAFANDHDPVAVISAAWRLQRGLERPESHPDRDVDYSLDALTVIMAALQPLERTDRFPELERLLVGREWRPLRMGKLQYQVTTLGATYREGAAMVVKLPGGDLGITTSALLYEYAAEREALEGRDAPVWVPGGNRLQMRRQLVERLGQPRQPDPGGLV